MADYSSLHIEENNPIFKLGVSEFRSEMIRRGYTMAEMDRLRRIRRKIKNRRYKREVCALRRNANGCALTLGRSAPENG